MLRRNIWFHLRKRRADWLSQCAQILAGASRLAKSRSFKEVFGVSRRFGRAPSSVSLPVGMIGRSVFCLKFGAMHQNWQQC